MNIKPTLMKIEIQLFLDSLKNFTQATKGDLLEQKCLNKIFKSKRQKVNSCVNSVKKNGSFSINIKPTLMKFEIQLKSDPLNNITQATKGDLHGLKCRN